MADEDITLPEEKSQRDPKSIFEESREPSEEEKKKVEQEKKFEFNEVAGREEREKEEVKEQKKGALWRWVVGILILALIVALYLWLIK